MKIETNDSWEMRISNFAKIINKSISEVEDILKQKPLFLSEETPNVLEMLSDEEIITFNDFRFLFVDKNNIPLPLLRMGLKFLRGPKDSRKEIDIDPTLFALKSKYGISITSESLPLESLLEFYDPCENNEIHSILKNKYESKYGKFIAFHPNTNELAIEDILNYIADLDTGFEKLDYLEINGEPAKLYYVGEKYNEKLEEDPLFPGFPLKKDRSTKNRISWEGVALKERQFFRILTQMGLIKCEDRISLSQIIGKPISDLKIIFPEAYVKFIELEKEDSLPKLKISINSVDKRIQDPFRIR